MGAQKTLAHWMPKQAPTSLCGAESRCTHARWSAQARCPHAFLLRAQNRGRLQWRRRQPPSCIFEFVVLNLYVTRTNHHTHCDRHPDRVARRRVRATSYRAPIRTNDTCGARRTRVLMEECGRTCGLNAGLLNPSYMSSSPSFCSTPQQTTSVLGIFGHQRPSSDAQEVGGGEHGGQLSHKKETTNTSRAESYHRTKAAQDHLVSLLS